MAGFIPHGAAKMPTISIPELGLRLQAGADDNLLKVLRRHEVPIRHSCKRGECGSCKCRLEAGHVEMAECSETALPRQQREQGLILACRARLDGDITLGLVDSDDYIAHPLRHLVATVLSLRELAPMVVALRAQIRWADLDGAPFVFSAGQYVRLAVGAAAAPEQARAFSIASTPVEAEYDDELEFHIRRNPDGAFSQLLGGAVAPGTSLFIEGPLGVGYFRPRHEGPLVAVGAGTGLAPMLSIVRTALANGKTDPVVLYAGFRSAGEVYGVEALDALRREYANFSAHLVVEEGASASQRSGLVGDALLEDVADFADAKVYLAGSPAMVHAVAERLFAHGLRAGDLHADAFDAARVAVRELVPGIG
jgi:ferredoxin-NAD(P)+ reductase (naphthalene dioxygenase ferredoxin-specific)